MVTSEHVDANTGFVALANRGGRLGTGGIIETDEAAEDEVLLELAALQLGFVMLDVADVGAGGEGKHTQTQTGHGFHVAEDVFLDLFGELLDLVADGILGTRGEDALDGALGEEPLLVGGLVLENHRHLLDVRVKGEFGNVTPFSRVTMGQTQTVPVEARSKHLDRNLGRVAAAAPLALDLGHGRQVGQGRNVEVVAQSRILGDHFLGVDGVALGTFTLEINILGLRLVESQVAHRGVEGLVGRADRVRAAAGDPGLLDNHVALCQGSSLVRADICLES